MEKSARLRHYVIIIGAVVSSSIIRWQYFARNINMTMCHVVLSLPGSERWTMPLLFCAYSLFAIQCSSLFITFLLLPRGRGRSDSVQFKMLTDRATVAVVRCRSVRGRIRYSVENFFFYFFSIKLFPSNVYLYLYYLPICPQLHMYIYTAEYSR